MFRIPASLSVRGKLSIRTTAALADCGHEWPMDGAAALDVEEERKANTLGDKRFGRL